MTFQARRQSCPVTNCLMKLLPQQHNYKPFARSPQELSRPCPSSLNSGAYSSTAPFQCKEPRKDAGSPQPGTGGWSTGTITNCCRISISYHTCMHLLLCPTSVLGKTDLELPEKCQQLHAGKEQVGGTGLIRLCMTNKHHVPQLQPTLKTFWLIFLRGCTNLSFYLFTSAETPTQNKHPALKVGKHDPWPSGCSMFPPLQ